jgi:hypothetical protein
MPFGRRQVAGGVTIDFDAVYQQIIQPAVTDAGLEPIRADEERNGGIIHKPMFERLLLCEYAVADLTSSNANVFYELGVRHAMRARSTVLLFAKDGGQLPFDVRMLRALPYRLAPGGEPEDAAGDRAVVAGRLRDARGPDSDSPLYQLLKDYPNVTDAETDVFQDRVRNAVSVKRSLERALRLEKGAREAVEGIEASLGPLGDAESGVLVDLLRAYREIEEWQAMVALIERMPTPLRESVLAQEQLGLALNRDARGEEAEAVLVELIARRGVSSETYGILGRVYKDRWEKALKDNSPALANGLLRGAADAYRKGFEADWRDAYPGVNAVTLMELMEPPDQRRLALLPVVRYAVERKIAAGATGYWDYASLVELAVLANDEKTAQEALELALASTHRRWQMESTVRNLGLIRSAWARRGKVVAWVDEVIRGLGEEARR